MRKKHYLCTMKMTLLLVGKTTDNGLERMIQDYVERLKHYNQLEICVLPELRNAKNLSEAQQKQLEGDMILQKVSPQTDLVLLDEHGLEMRSLEFAAYMQKKMSAGRELTFVIGGPYGFSEAVYQRANGKISLSRMTFSHQMIRLLFTEQLYRAFTILRGEKYHHE